MSNKKNISLNWEEFKMLGNPDNVPEQEQSKLPEPDHTMDVIRIFLDRKARKGKEVTIIRGHQGDDDTLKSLGKELKSKCGVGGTVKDDEIILQGNHRKKVMEILLDKGFKNVKLAGG